MKHIGFGIIGIGRQGLRLAEHIRNDITYAKLVAVCRRSEDKHDYSKKHGIKFYTDYQELLRDQDIDAVIITTPSSLHGIHSLDALRSGKHVLIDKPIASSVEEGEEILSLSKRDKLTVGVNFPLRVNPVTAVLRKHLGTIGKLMKIQIVVSHGPPTGIWQSDSALSNGGVILDLGSHYFDLVSFITGYQPEMIDSAFSEEEVNEHSGFVDFTLKSISVSMVLLRNQKLKKNFITCAGDKGLIFADYALKEVITSNHHEVNEIKCPASNDFETILSNFVRTINRKDNIIAGAEDGIRSLRTVLSVYRAIGAKAPVEIKMEKA